MSESRANTIQQKTIIMLGIIVASVALFSVPGASIAESHATTTDPVSNLERISPISSSSQPTTVQPIIASTTLPRERDDDNEYEQILDTILNQTIEPEKPATKSVKRQPSIVAEKATTTKPVQSQPAPPSSTRDNTQSTTSPNIASSTPVAPGTVDRPTLNDSNQITPTNYYIPLDNLSPETTYALSSLAMLCGVIGSLFVIRDSRAKEEEVWVPHFEQSLLEH